jgi:hypothetical protein
MMLALAVTGRVTVLGALPEVIPFHLSAMEAALGMAMVAEATAGVLQLLSRSLLLLQLARVETVMATEEMVLAMGAQLRPLSLSLPREAGTATAAVGMAATATDIRPVLVTMDRLSPSTRL